MTSDLGRYKPAVLGSLIGLVVGGLIVGFTLAVVAGTLGLATSWQPTPAVLLAAAAAGLLGAPVGCGVALRSARQPGAITTAVLMLGLLLLAGTTLLPALVELEVATLWSLRLPLVFGVLAAAWSARKLTLLGGRENVVYRTPRRQPH